MDRDSIRRHINHSIFSPNDAKRHGDCHAAMQVHCGSLGICLGRCEWKIIDCRKRRTLTESSYSEENYQDNTLHGVDLQIPSVLLY